MALHPEDQRSIIQYLLGELAQEEQRQVEERLLTDDEYYEELLIAEDELIDQYLNGQLSEYEKERFGRHFLATSERQQKLRFARSLMRYISTSVSAEERDISKSNRPLPWLQSFFNPYLVLAVSVLIILGLGLGIWRVFFYQSDIAKGLVALRTAYREQRPIEARISGFDYAPAITSRGGPDKVDYIARDRAERLLLDAVSENPSPASHHAMGKFYLAERNFDRAIDQFEKGLSREPNNAQLHSDLGAALMEAGKAEPQEEDQGERFEKFAKGLEHLNRALELDGSLLEALFNRALCYQYMLLPQQAESDWRKYLEKDPTSQWADEARRNLDLIEKQKKRISQNKDQLFEEFVRAYQVGNDDNAWDIFRQNRDLRGGFLINRLIDAYLNSKVQGRDSEAARNLQLLSYVGRLETQRTGDRFISALANYYQTTPARRALLVQARKLLKQGHEYLDQSRLEEAVEAYKRAKQIFQQTGNTAEAIYIEYPLGHCYLLQSHLKFSLSTFQGVARTCESTRYKWLLARALNAIATVEMYLNNYSAALDHSRRSLNIFEQIGDTNGVMKITHQLGEEYVYLSNYHKALSLYQRSLALTAVYSPEPIQLWRNYFSISRPLNLLGLYLAAVEYQREALRLALETGMPQLVCRSYISLGLMLGSLQRYEEATQNIRLAFELGQQLSDQKARTETIAYSSLQLGNLYRQAGDYEKAVENYNDAIRLYSELNNPAFNYVAHKGKMLSCMARGGCQSDEQEIKTALDLFERYRSKILEESSRNSFFDAGQSIYDLAIDYEYTKRGDPRIAFDYSERSRARSLLDLTNVDAQAGAESSGPDILLSRPSQPLSLAEIQTRLPEQVQVLQYAVLEDKLLAWVITSASFSSSAQAVALKELNQKVLDYLKAVSTPSEGNEEALQHAADLYDLLIKPLQPRLDSRKQIIVVPDKVLNQLPYGALYARAAGKYFVEEYTVSLAPSSNILIVCSDKARQKEGAVRERVLSVGNPRFDRQAFPSLADLPSASKEAEAVAACYGLFNAVTGAEATKGRIKDEMKRAEVVHLALHSVVDEKSPLRSKLLLAKETARQESDGILYSREIYGLKLPLTRLVVLSSCRSGVERYYGGEGMVGLSRPFIAAGVPVVVASLWPVDSDSTSELMVSFHRQRQGKKFSTAEALRRAQLEMLNGPEQYRHPYYWAPFIAIGGYTTF